MSQPVTKRSAAATTRYALFVCLATLLVMELIAASVLATTGEGAAAFIEHPPLINPTAIGGAKSANARLSDAVYGEYFVFDPTLGARFRPGSLAYGMTYDAKQDVMRYAKEMALQVDKQGFVANHDSTPDSRDFAVLANATDVLKVVVSGGSTVAGWGATKNSAVWPAVLERKLNEYLRNLKGPWHSAVVINSGVFGYNITQEIHRFQEETRYLNPTIVVCFDGINEQQGYKGNPVNFSFGQAQAQLLRESAAPTKPVFMPFTRRLLQKFAAPERLPNSYGYREKGIVTLTDAELFLDKSRQFKRIADLAGAKFFHLLQPIMGVGARKYTDTEKRMRAVYFASPEKDEEYMRKMRGFYAGVHEHMTEPWQTDFSASLDEAPDTVYADPRHYNDRGQELLAEKVFALLIEKGLS